MSRGLSSRSSGSESSERYRLWDNDDSSSMTSDTSTHAVSKFEAYFYYHGIRGDRRLGPKLIFRTSTDEFVVPTEPGQEPRKIQLLSMHKHAKLQTNNLWATVRKETVGILDQRQVQLTSVDLARFCWKEDTADGRSKTVFSRVTIWIGVVPDSTNGDTAFDSCQPILQLLSRYSIDDVDVAYRESDAQLLAGPPLYAPVSDLHPLKDVMEWITTALTVPIAGVKTLQMQGTLGFYFKVGDDLYGVTARHILFPGVQGNVLYNYTSGPRKDVVVMGNKAFDDFLASIQANIGSLNGTVKVLKKRVASLTTTAHNGNGQAASDLADTRADLEKKEKAIEDLKDFFATMKKDWAAVNKRVIGQVVWAPPISGLNGPDGYTVDICVVKLNERKFKNWKGNVIDLGTKIESGKFMSLMYPRDNSPSEFDYPETRLYKIKKILAAAKIKESNNFDMNGDPVRFVIKSGHTTGTTVGRLTGFESHKRQYDITGNFDSIEAAIYPYDNDSSTFSRRGDSGSAIVGADNDIIALLTGGSGPTDSSDITYGTPMEWLWNKVIKVKFPGAVLFFDDIPDN
ncbi:hypothetical protein BT69DRAFT_1327670 [Atractiella rhizophila]|nr:hypothetical protein BT69DRAFT_1327670 [Atractiella rhizophila]